MPGGTINVVSAFHIAPGTCGDAKSKIVTSHYRDDVDISGFIRPGGSPYRNRPRTGVFGKAYLPLDGR